jgi:hypothetical protein
MGKDDVVVVEDDEERGKEERGECLNYLQASMSGAAQVADPLNFLPSPLVRAEDALVRALALSAASSADEVNELRAALLESARMHEDVVVGAESEEGGQKMEVGNEVLLSNDSNSDINVSIDSNGASGQNNRPTHKFSWLEKVMGKSFAIKSKIAKIDSPRAALAAAAEERLTRPKQD